jgi:hypothetical protein
MADETPAPLPVKFYAAILRADGEYVVEEFDDVEALAAALKNLINKDVSVFPFMGQRLHISKPPLRFLMLPTGNVPLFDVQTDNLEPDTTGYLGLDPVYFEEPPQLKVPKPKAPGDADEFFDDNDSSSALGVFDGLLPDPDQ